MSTTTPVRPAAATTSPLQGGAFVGLGSLLRLHLRRDRLILIAWLVVVGALPALIVSATRAGYPDQAAMDGFAAAAMASPGELATRGPVFAVTVGGLTAWTIASSTSLIMGVVGILLGVRHSRADEQAGRLELVGAGRVGRIAPLAAALVVPVLGALAIGVLAAAGLLAQGMPVTGSVLLGAVMAGSAAVFGAIGVLAAQLVESPGAARGIAIVCLGIAFALAAVGDLGGNWLVWLSPIGWTRHAESFAGNHGWVVLLPAVSTVLLAVAAGVLGVRRDLGAGLFAARPGRSTARAWLATALALAWRRQRGTLIAWMVGMGLLGLLLGSVTSSLNDQLDTPAFRQLSAGMGGLDVGQVFFLFVVYVMSQVATAAAVATALQLRTDETSGLAEQVLVRAVPRWRWAAGQLLIAAAVAAGVLTAIGLTAGLTSGRLPGLLLTTWAYLPAALVLIGLAAALVGWLPRAALPVTWAVLGLLLALDLVGEFGLVDPAVVNISPYALTLAGLFGNAPLVPLLVGLTALALVLAVVGLVGIRRRDLG